MAETYTAPASFSYKEAPGSSKLNEQVVNNIKYLKESMPAGIIMQYGGSTAPDQWLLCNGAAISRSTYSVLYNIIGTTYGIGDGSNTFNLPDFQGRFPLGKSGSYALGVAAGDATKNLAHTHTGPSHTHTYSGNTGYESGTDDAGDEGTDHTYADNNHYHAYSGTTSADGTGVTSSSGSATQDIMPPYQVVNYIIKY